jgi:SAM-dependent methyltransferase
MDYSKIPFADPGDKDEIRAALRHRLRVVRKFIGKGCPWVGLHTLDIGDTNKFGRALGVKDNTLEGDLNKSVRAPSKDYDVVTCFEVIEHVMNPLGLMGGIYRLLKKGGRCYISTPVRTILFPILEPPKHFTEYRRVPMEKLFGYVGFKVVKYKRFTLWDWNFMFWGVRPFLRVLFQRNQMWELRK